MIAINIGRTFLKAYNDKFKVNLSPKQFFEDQFFELFFNHPKYMQWVTNSPFVQMKKGQKPHLLSPNERKEKLVDLQEKLQDGIIDASTAIGFPASKNKEYATTSGLVSDIDPEYLLDDLYYSWIGGGMGIGVAGGYSILFNNPNVLLSLYEGWRVYRKYLNDETFKKLSGKQIDTWNGQWLNFRYSKEYKSGFDFNDLQKNEFFNIVNNEIKVNTIKWSQLFFNLSRQFPSQIFLGYVYSLGQTNKTLGFFPFQFTKARKLINYYEILFGEQAAIQDAKSYESLYGIHIKRACELGSIGLQALEPKDIRKFMGNEKSLKFVDTNVKRTSKDSDEDYEKKKAEIAVKDNEILITYKTYKTWLLAMITKNKEQLVDYTTEIAAILYEYKTGTTKTTRTNLIENDLLVSKSKKSFLNTLCQILDDIDEQYLEKIKELRDHVHLMTVEDFQYFVTLLKFDYSFTKRNS